MKFLADMGISPRTVAALKDHGHDAVHLNENSLGRLKDSDILTKAFLENRILLTHDLDFGELVAASMKPGRVLSSFAYTICNPIEYFII